MTDQHESDASALGHLRVLDLGGPTTQFATRILGDLGADVIKIEPPGGDPLRNQAPFANGQPGPDRSIPFLSDNHNKRSVVLDLETDDGRDATSANSPPPQTSSSSPLTAPTLMISASVMPTSQPPTPASSTPPSAPLDDSAPVATTSARSSPFRP